MLIRCDIMRFQRIAFIHMRQNTVIIIIRIPVIIGFTIEFKKTIKCHNRPAGTQHSIVRAVRDINRNLVQHSGLHLTAIVRFQISV